MLTLTRYKSTDQGTRGILTRPDGFYCHTIELPFRDNQPNISCIPPGFYEMKYLERSASGRYKNVYHLQNVEGRGGILIHQGNLAGDESKGYRTHSAGCILVGAKCGVLGAQDAVLASRPTLRKLMQKREPGIMVHDYVN